MIRRLTCALLFAASLSLFAADDSAKNDLLITLERTSCFGSCPVYKLTVRGDGTVIYEGNRFVRVTGRRKARIGQQALADLIQAFSACNYLDLQDSYIVVRNPDGSESVVTDLPMTITSLTKSGRHKTVEDYVGAPQQLRDLEHKIDAIAGSKRWVAIDASSVHEEVRRGWDVRGTEAKKLFSDAAERGDVEVVQAFINEGADVNGRFRKLTPLQVARGAAVVKLLISSGADVNAKSDRYFGPPIVLAANLGDVDSVRALLDAGAKVNAASSDGETALIEAAESGVPSLVKLLLQAGADPKARTASGYNATDLAKYGLDRQKGLAKHTDPFLKPLADFQRKYEEIEDMLSSAGAEPAR